MDRAALIYPHQLFNVHPALEGCRVAVLVEEPLLFSQYRFHRKKLLLHRASMRSYAQTLSEGGVRVHYVEAHDLSQTGDVARFLREFGIRKVNYVDPCDDWIGRFLSESLRVNEIEARVLAHPHFLTALENIEQVAHGRKKLFFTNFYIGQRRRLGVLVDPTGKPEGGQWSFDHQNRRRLPKHLAVPTVPELTYDGSIEEARAYVRRCFPEAIGEDSDFNYPVSREQAFQWLQVFLEERFGSFGDYEDSISQEHQILFHSVLTPALNIGLISPREVLDEALERADQIPLNSLEGFIRQVIGWREFMRLAYVTKGRQQRTRNFWGFGRPMPQSLYTGETGIEPVDATVRKILGTGYCHHIERLMILGNFMLLCEIEPNSVYQWFMELFIDAYDWVMVPNVYGMSQFADGGLITTKPYLSSSNYILKMSNFKSGPWCEVWDALFWRFVFRHREVFETNPRLRNLSLLCSRMGNLIDRHIAVADEFLAQLK